MGEREATISNCYSKGNVTSIASGNSGSRLGGLTGWDHAGESTSSYSLGVVSGNSSDLVGGYVGSPSDEPYVSDYWDIGTSGSDQGTGDGNIAGIVGLKAEEFKSGLPDGFDPNVWAEDRNINNGYPYLIANPPPK